MTCSVELCSIVNQFSLKRTVTVYTWYRVKWSAFNNKNNSKKKGAGFLSFHSREQEAFFWLDNLQARMFFSESAEIFRISERDFIQIIQKDTIHRRHRSVTRRGRGRERERDGHCSNRCAWGCLLHQRSNCAQGKKKSLTVHVMLLLCNQVVFCISRVEIKSRRLSMLMYHQTRERCQF